MRRQVPIKEIKILFAQSGGICAFPGCGRQLMEPGTDYEDPAFLGEIAHIVAETRQGPRGQDSLSDEDRSRAANLILLCPDHHTLVDSRPRTYSVPVLHQMKHDHETAVQRALSRNGSVPRHSLRGEKLHSTLLEVTDLPAVVYSAESTCPHVDDEQFKKLVTYPNQREILIPFLRRENRLFAFQDLRKTDNPFRSVTSRNSVEEIQSVRSWSEPEGKRRYVALLNSALRRYAASLGLRFDRDHHRFYFPVVENGKERSITYRPLNQRRAKRRVVWQPIRKATGEPRRFWWHFACSMAIHQMDRRTWCLSLRPERHLTTDGQTPLESLEIGRRVTRLKARMYNDLYLAEVNFWRDYLAQGKPRIILNFLDQVAVIETRLLPFVVQWPGIPGDDKPFANQGYEDDLFTLADLFVARSGRDEEDEFFEELERDRDRDS